MRKIAHILIWKGVVGKYINIDSNTTILLCVIVMATLRDKSISMCTDLISHYC